MAIILFPSTYFYVTIVFLLLITLVLYLNHKKFVQHQIKELKVIETAIEKEQIVKEKLNIKDLKITNLKSETFKKMRTIHLEIINLEFSIKELIH